ncbi:MAG: hypothetical protein HFH24_12830 [Ruminococcus sp.]|nr:hypothetical protein [Ruminococcus sp.]
MRKKQKFFSLLFFGFLLFSFCPAAVCAQEADSGDGGDVTVGSPALDAQADVITGEGFVFDQTTGTLTIDEYDENWEWPDSLSKTEVTALRIKKAAGVFLVRAVPQCLRPTYLMVTKW